MSRAFVREDDQGAGAVPERPVSDERNIVTGRGLGLIEAEVERRQAEVAAADDDETAARAARELRYWIARLATAERVVPDAGTPAVMFGVAVTVEDQSGRQRTMRIVGEDEAAPELGRIAWPAPVARALMGKEVGDTVRLPTGEVEVVAVDATPEPERAAGAAAARP